jgi:hypothetical protein
MIADSIWRYACGEGGSMDTRTRIALGIAAGCAAAFLSVTPLQAQPPQQQQPETSLPEQLIEGVRGIFKRLFGEGAATPALETPAASEAPRSQPASFAPVPAAAPTALTLSQSLHEAVVRGDYEATLRMLEQGIDIESRDPGSGASPLHYAVMKGRLDIVNLLLTRGADVNSRTRNGTTPLHTAALYSRSEVAERLLEGRADINAVSASGATPLALASAAKNRPIADMLKARGAK